MLVPIGSNNSVVFRRENQGNLRGMKELDMAGISPEKAGVGGSIPSLATMSFKELHASPSIKRQPWSPNGVQTQKHSRGIHCFSIGTKINPCCSIEWYPG